MPIADLKDLKSHFDTIVYVSYLTVQPEQILVNDYVERMITELSDKNWFGFWILFAKQQTRTAQQCGYHKCQCYFLNYW